MNPFIVGFAGYARSGKTTAATEFRRQWDGPCGATSFAHPIKATAYSMGWNGQKDERGRRLLQLLGTECGRNLIGPDVWIMALEAELKFQRLTMTTIDDVRFANEVDWIKSKGGIVIRIVRADQIPDRSHSSETETEDIIMPQINNATSPEALGRMAVRLVQESTQWQEYCNADRN